MSDTSLTITDPSKLTPVELWCTEIDAAEKELEKFHKRGRNVTRKFLDERETMQTSQKWFNIFYANTSILESALYAQLPKASVSRKYKDYHDDVARVAGMIIERAISQDLDDPTDTLDATIRHCVQDRLVPGLAQAWLRLETETQEVESPPPTPGTDPYGEEIGEGAYANPPGGMPADPIEEITSQKVCVDYIFWADFLWSPCRVWEERRWVGRKVYMNRDQLVKRFGTDKGNRCPLNFSLNEKDESQGSTPRENVIKMAVVYEIWDRVNRKVIWYCKGMLDLLDEKDDFLKLVGFEPCPKPMLANISTSNTVPRPDYYMIQDQYTELDTVNNRISMLVQACKVIGVYNKNGGTGIQDMLINGQDNVLIPVDDWAMFAEKGGIKGNIDWLPLDVVVQALEKLNQAREAIKGQIYELTGIADIVRGASKASETLGAQQIKAQFASVRIKKLQDEVARFASDIMRIKAEIMVKHFDPDILIQKSNILRTDNDQYVADAMILLSEEEGFEWRITVTADTLAQADYSMEKQDRIEMMTAASKYMAQFGPIIEAKPEMAPIFINLLKWSVAGFRGARDIEGMLDKQLDAMEAAARKPKPPPPPSPEQIKAKAEADKAQAASQLAQQKGQIDMQGKQMDMQMAQQENQMMMMFKQFEMRMEEQRLDMEQRADERRIAAEERESRMELMFARLMAQLKLETEEELAELKLESAHDLAAVQIAQAKAKPKPSNGSATQ